MVRSECVIILAGGQGSRLKPYTTVLPKPLIPICDVPILEVVIHQLHDAGFRKIILAVNHLEALVRTYFGDGSELGVDIRYSREDRELGTIGPLHLVADELSDSFLVMNGDLLTDLPYAACLDAHLASGRLLTLGAYRKTVQIGDGVVEFGDDGALRNFNEKPAVGFWISMGVYAMSREILGHIPRHRAFGMDQLVLSLLRAGISVGAFPHGGEWYDIGCPGDLERAGEAFAQRRGVFLAAPREREPAVA